MARWGHVMTMLRTALFVRIAAASCLAMSVQAHAADLTGLAGGGQAFSTYQPSLVLNSYVTGSRDAVPAGSVMPMSIAQEQPSLGLRYLIATQGQYPFRDTNPGYDGTYLGEVITYAGADFSGDRYRGFVEAAGQLLNISQNVALYS
ncbi:MAG: hypothetical protein EOO77_26155, partial [Oxalobacteraceae bacterium]